MGQTIIVLLKSVITQSRCVLEFRPLNIRVISMKFF